MAQAPRTQPPDERARIEQILAREGPERARAWARRTEALYRTAVLDRAHFAHTPEYRRRFIESYLQLKRFALGARAREPRSGGHAGA